MMNKTKKKNVYVKYAVIMCISGALGGILGGVMEMGEYSRAVTPQIRQAGNRLSGLAETAYASLLA